MPRYQKKKKMSQSIIYLFILPSKSNRITGVNVGYIYVGKVLIFLMKILGADLILLWLAYSVKITIWLQFPGSYFSL